VVDVEPFPAESVEGAEFLDQRIRALQVLGPESRPGGDLVVQLAQRLLLGCGDRPRDRDEEVAIALQVRVAERERALQVGADERVAEDPVGGRGQFLEEFVQLAVRRRILLHDGRIPQPVIT
jgi:hypothetical protein